MIDLTFYAENVYDEIIANELYEMSPEQLVDKLIDMLKVILLDESDLAAPNDEYVIQVFSKFMSIPDDNLFKDVILYIYMYRWIFRLAYEGNITISDKDRRNLDILKVQFNNLVPNFDTDIGKELLADLLKRMQTMIGMSDRFYCNIRQAFARNK
ncbi:hypothetical protein SAMN02745163_03473 [Clostridium cavendishii DSM 21758]|uniref:Uncharacterized protein n=1 Tax=Clostridium cavendishii DSM 21758 TaxID=1121302 RepID=A0A1M6QVX7_9CLOT|nr:hypothetical protein [Clostridium cavendishii]SHK24422.1 hypothetical protein SAMN02745163_03473 [Clostridium cavendishii DSM 21758]